MRGFWRWLQGMSVIEAFALFWLVILVYVVVYGLSIMAYDALTR